MFEMKHLDPQLNFIFKNNDNRNEKPRVHMRYVFWPDYKEKVKSMASWLSFIDLDEEGKARLDSGNELRPEWDWYQD